MNKKNCVREEDKSARRKISCWGKWKWSWIHVQNQINTNI